MFNFDIFSFLSPYNGKFEILPFVFFTIITFLFLATWISFVRNANPKNWENNWNTKNLDIEQGTISELSDAVSTKSEKVALAMPGIILVIGLLGTFIGLGLALDKASNILSSADMNNVDSSMGQLMGMMEGLGTKFKTSTWGLIAFILLKSLSSQNNFEEKRLSWISNKIREILTQRQLDLKQENEENLHKILMSITSLSENVSDRHLESNKLRSDIFSDVKRNSLNHIIDKLVLVSEIGQNQISTINEGFEQIKQESLKSHKEMITSIDSAFNKMLEKQDSINTQNSVLLTKLNKNQIDLFNQQHAEVTKTTNEMSRKLAETFVQAMASLQEQQSKHSDTNQDNLKELAQRICGSIELQQSKIIDAVDKNSHYLDLTAKESQQTRQAMDKFVDESLNTIEHLKQSAAGMSQAAQDMGGSASKLQTVIDSLSQEMNALLATMKKDLGNTIENMDKSFVANMNKMTTDLTNTISDMNQNFKLNMTEMAKGLGIATNDISNAVNELSTSVDKTMTEVSRTINESMNLQKKAQSVFIETSDNLNEQIISMTQLVEKLSDDITSGLDAISDSNRQVISLNKKYNTSSDKVEDLIKVVEQTQCYSRELKDLLSEISNNLDQNRVIFDNVKNIEKYCSELINLLKDIDLQKRNSEYVISASTY